MPRKLRVGVALGGGAARGLAHLGVLRGLARIGIVPSVVAGTSAGALVGALYAASGDLVDAEARLRGFVSSPDFARMRLRFLLESRDRPQGGIMDSLSSLVKKGIVLGYSVARTSFVSVDEFARHMAALIPDIRIEQAQVPLVVVAADLATGREVDLTHGSMRLAVSGSCAIPGILPPIPLDSWLLVDGGWVNMVPVAPARALGVDFVLAVDVSTELEDSSSVRSGLSILTRANAITAQRLLELQLAAADFVLRPDVRHLHWADFARLDDAIASGERAVEMAREALLEQLARRDGLMGRLRLWRAPVARTR